MSGAPPHSSGFYNPFASQPAFTNGNANPPSSTANSSYPQQTTYAQQAPSNGTYPTSNHQHHHPPPPHPADSPQPRFEILEWYPAYQSCQRHFIDRSQHDHHTQMLAAFLNIQLPCQWRKRPVSTSNPAPHPSHHSPTYPQMNSNNNHNNISTSNPAPPWASPPPSPSNPSLIPYIRRLVVTAYDAPTVLHSIFGDDWRRGVGCQVEVERRNYLFTAKSLPWAAVKAHYDMDHEQTVPFLRPPREVAECEVESAEAAWSDWLFVRDWQVVPGGARAKREDAEGFGMGNGVDGQGDEDMGGHVRR